MPETEQRILTTCYRFENGNVMAFDQHGRQMPKYQGTFDKVAPLVQRDYPGIAIEPMDWASTL